MNGEDPRENPKSLLRDNEELQGQFEKLLDEQAVRGDFFSAFGSITTDRASDETATESDVETIVEVPIAGASIGDYDLIEQIAQGGMGVVFKARQRSLDRIVALKVMSTSTNASTAAARFLAETQAVAKLSHPHILPIYEVGRIGNVSYFTMKYFDGGTLGQHASTIRDDTVAIAGLMVKVGHAIEHAHRRGILHRDLKPSNVLMDQDGQPHVADFGLAKRIDVASDLTQTGAAVGTPGYMAPEQIRGSESLTTACDVYGLGAILYELLTGQPPFRRKNSALTLLAVLNEEPESLTKLRPDLDRDLATIGMKSLEKLPAARYASAQEFADDLHRYLQGEPIRARPVSTGQRALKWAKRRPAVAALMALLAASILAGSLGSTVFALDAQKRAQNETRLRAEAERQTVQANLARQKETQLRRESQRREHEAKWHAYSAAMQSAAYAFTQRRFGHVESLLSQTTPTTGQADFRGWEWYYHQSQLNRQQQTLGQDLTWMGMDWHPGTGRLVFDSNSKFQIWDVANRKLLNSFPCPPNIYRYAWSNDGNHFAVGQSEGVVIIYEAATGNEICQYRFPTFEQGSLLEIAWRPGHDQVVCVNSRHEAILLDATTGQVVRTFPQVQSTASCGWNSDGSRLAIAGTAGWVQMFDPDQTEPIWQDQVNKFNLSRTRWSPDDTKLAFCTKSHLGEIVIVDDQGDLVQTIKGHPGASVNDAAWIDNDHLISGGADQLVKRWNVTTGKLLAQYHVLNGNIESIKLSPDRQHFAALSFRRPIKIVALDTVTPTHRQWQCDDQMIHSIDWDSSGKRLVSSGFNQAVCIWDVETTACLQRFKIDPQRNVFRVDWSPDDRFVVAIVEGQSAQLLDVENHGSLKLASQVNAAHIDTAFSNDGRTLVLTCGDGTIQWWDTTMWTVRAQQKKNAFLRCMHWSPDDTTLVAIPASQGVRLIDAATGKLTHSKFQNRIQNPKWRPDGGTFVAAGLGGELAFYQINELNEPFHRSYGHLGSVHDVVWSPDGTRIASCGIDSTVRIWDAATADLLLTIATGNETPMVKIVWSPDGNRIAASDQAGMIYVFGEKGMIPEQVAIDSWDEGIVVQTCPLKTSRKE